jgi:hypothetical protein
MPITNQHFEKFGDNRSSGCNPVVRICSQNWAILELIIALLLAVLADKIDS